MLLVWVKWRRRVRWACYNARSSCSMEPRVCQRFMPVLSARVCPTGSAARTAARIEAASCCLPRPNRSKRLRSHPARSLFREIVVVLCKRTSKTSVRLRQRAMQLEIRMRASIRHCTTASVNSIGRCRRRARTLGLRVALPSGCLPGGSGSGSADLVAVTCTDVRATDGQTVTSS